MRQSPERRRYCSPAGHNAPDWRSRIFTTFATFFRTFNFPLPPLNAPCVPRCTRSSQGPEANHLFCFLFRFLLFSSPPFLFFSFPFPPPPSSPSFRGGQNRERNRSRCAICICGVEKWPLISSSCRPSFFFFFSTEPRVEAAG